MALLPKVNHSSFLNQLATREEKIGKLMVNKTKNIISTFKFTTGFMGTVGGGETITLDDGKQVTVPSTVKTQWEIIKNAGKNIDKNTLVYQ